MAMTQIKSHPADPRNDGSVSSNTASLQPATPGHVDVGGQRLGWNDFRSRYATTSEHRQAEANISNSSSTNLKKFHHTQRIASKAAAPISVLNNDMPNNEDEQAAPAKRHHLKLSPPAWLTCLSSMQHDVIIAF